METSTPPLKRLKLDDASPSKPDPATIRLQRSALLSTLSRPVSPPPQSGGRQTESDGSDQPVIKSLDSSDIVDLTSSSPESHTASRKYETVLSEPLRAVSSPFHLTRSHDLPQSANVDTVTIRDLLGNPLIKEAWIFNYCHDVDWTMQQFDPDVRALVSVKIIHGFWKRESGGKLAIDEACARYPNVKPITAYLPDAFGTHHSKMIILFRHDELAQVIIHTANMLPGDWHNATQAVWCSPLLPLGARRTPQSARTDTIGSGERFEQDLRAYLEGYGSKLSTLVKSLGKHDFSEVRGALIASIPSKIPPIADLTSTKAWGHVALNRALSTIPTAGVSAESSLKSGAKPTSPIPKSTIVAQVSSIATFTSSWLHDTLFTSLTRSSRNSNTKPRVAVIFPTPKEVARSLDGYSCGGSIHCKTQSAAHQRQIDFLRPYLCHWATPEGKAGGSEEKDTREERMDAQRGRAAPHIKTYMRISPSEHADADSHSPAASPKIDWALLTSANLSSQAWGTAPKKPSKKERDEEGLKEEFVHIQSYEIGVLVWPGLWAEEGKEVEMVPCFGQNTPTASNEGGHEGRERGIGGGRRLGSDLDTCEDAEEEKERITVGMRMPFDLPLTPYAPGENPWSPGGVYAEPDSHGFVWPMSFA